MSSICFGRHLAYLMYSCFFKQSIGGYNIHTGSLRRPTQTTYFSRCLGWMMLKNLTPIELRNVQFISMSWVSLVFWEIALNASCIRPILVKWMLHCFRFYSEYNI